MKNILFLLLLPVLSFAEPFIVQDTTNTLTSEETNNLISKLKEIKETKNVIISVQIISTTGEQTIFDYSQHLFDTLQLGNKDSDNGLLFVIAKNDRKMRLHIGYGLENTITDAFSKRVLTNITQKYFKSNNFYTGISLTIDEIVVQLTKEPVYSQQQLAVSDNNHNLIIVLSIMLLTFVVGMSIYLIIRYLQFLRDSEYKKYLDDYKKHYNPKPLYPSVEEKRIQRPIPPSPQRKQTSTTSSYDNPVVITDSSRSSSSSDSLWSSSNTGGSSSGAGSESSW